MNAFPELEQLEGLIARSKHFIKSRVLGYVELPHYHKKFPIWGLVLGPTDKTLPTLGLFAGVHGLERIGTQVVLAYLHNRIERIFWDRLARERFEQCRLVIIPMVNPGGIFLKQRSNPRGVDLMRNAPVEAVEKPHFLVGGQRYSNRLPWYRGQLGAPMEQEAQALSQFVEEEMFGASLSIALDVHSGFGFHDRLWYPYAKTRELFPNSSEIQNLTKLLSITYPHHVYKIEEQSQSYTTHGDLWDYLYDKQQSTKTVNNHVFLPLTLEMGSWRWVQKNFWQLFTRLGLFHPHKPHRTQRVLRRHLVLIDFLLRAVDNYDNWLHTKN